MFKQIENTTRAEGVIDTEGRILKFKIFDEAKNYFVEAPVVGLKIDKTMTDDEADTFLYLIKWTAKNKKTSRHVHRVILKENAFRMVKIEPFKTVSNKVKIVVFPYPHK